MVSRSNLARSCRKTKSYLPDLQMFLRLLGKYDPTCRRWKSSPFLHSVVRGSGFRNPRADSQTARTATGSVVRIQCQIYNVSDLYGLPANEAYGSLDLSGWLCSVPA